MNEKKQMEASDGGRTVWIGTRGSELALAQARELKRRLEAANDDTAPDFEIAVISTKGDRVLDRPLAEIGGKGLFTEEIEAQLADGRIDMAVHSSKDMPTALPEGLELSCFLPRETVADAFISPVAGSIEALPEGAVIGSASLRRQALIRRMRPDIAVVTFRGNVQTRLRKLAEGEVHATLLAHAGLRRLGLEDQITAELPIDGFPPAPGQGAICVETRIGDSRIAALLDGVGHEETALALACERAFLAGLDGSCRTPIAGLATINGSSIEMHGMILSPDGAKCHETRLQGDIGDPAALGTRVADTLRTAAGSGFFEDWS